MTATAQTLTVRVPLAVRKRGGRKTMVTPEGATAWQQRHARIDSTLVKALARAYRWRRMLETGRFGTFAELAAAEQINESYVSRILRLTLLAPGIVEVILDGRQPQTLTLPRLIQPFPAGWAEHRTTFDANPAAIAGR